MCHRRAVRRRIEYPRSSSTHGRYHRCSNTDNRWVGATHKKDSVIVCMQTITLSFLCPSFNLRQQAQNGRGEQRNARIYQDMEHHREEQAICYSIEECKYISEQNCNHDTPPTLVGVSKAKDNSR